MDTVKEWQFETSMFRNLRFETEDLIQSCFVVDINMTKISKVIKNPVELQDINDLLSDHYKLFKDAYKYYASLNPIGEIWCIQTPQLKEMLNDIDIQLGENEIQ